MKNINKLAFSMYALTLVLAASGAYAGSYDPTCDGNYADLSFANMSIDPLYNSNQNQLPDKYQKFTTEDCKPYSFFWGTKSTDAYAPDLLTGDLAMFCYRIQAPEGSPYLGEEYDGKTVTGWKLQGWYTDSDSGMVSATKEIIIPAPASSENGRFAVDASEQYFEQAPETTSWRYSFEPVWDELVYKLSLSTNCDTTDCGVNGIPGTFPVNYWLYVDGTGLYLSSDPNRLNLMTNSANPVAPLPTRTGYTFEGFNVSGVYSESNACTPTTLEAARNCLWINSSGNVVREDLGQFYAESQATAEPITTLKATWRPHKFTVKYDITSGIPSGWKGSINTTGIPSSHTCTFDGDCAVATGVPTSNQLIFTGWKCTSGCRTAIVPDGTILTGGDDISNANFTDNGTVTLTAQWEVRKNTVNFYTDKSTTTTPVDTLYYVYGGYWFNSEADADAGVASKLTKAPTPLTGATKSGYTLRGWVFDHTGYTATVEEDAGALSATALVASDTGTLTTNTGTWEGRFSVSETKTVSAYGTWARNCVENGANVAECELIVMEDGTVWYKNACDTGFHMTLDDEIVYEENMDKTND